MHTLTYPYSQESRLTFTLSWTNQIISAVKYLLGTLGLVLLFPVVLFLLGILVIQLNWLYRLINRDTRVILNELDSLSGEELVNVHLAYERNRASLRELFKKEVFTSNIRLFNPVVSISKKMFALVSKTEATLKRAAYPNLGVPLTEERTEELLEICRDADDWQDEELDAYLSYL